MRLLMIGTGGIGAYYGFTLQAAGNEVVYTARGEHLAALQQNGLTLEYEGTRHHSAVKALDHVTLSTEFSVNYFDLVIITVKATSTHTLLGEIGDWLLQSDVPVLSLQNGVDNEQVLDDFLGEDRVIGGLAVKIGSHLVSPGYIKATGKAEIITGIWPNNKHQHDPRLATLNCFKEQLSKASIPHKISPNILLELWRKLVINNAVNPLSALTGLDTYELTHQPDLQEIVRNLMAETQRAAKADGINLTDQDIDEMFNLIKSFNPIKTSMLVDKQNGKPLELASIVGVVIERSNQLGIDAPYNKVMNTLLSLTN